MTVLIVEPLYCTMFSWIRATLCCNMFSPVALNNFYSFSYRIIQNFIMREQTGALAPPSSDEHKVRHSRRGGIMASVFSGTRQHIHDMSLELSVEMNRKMQSVLEDILLKNITLKVSLITNAHVSLEYSRSSCMIMLV